MVGKEERVSMAPKLRGLGAGIALRYRPDQCSESVYPLAIPDWTLPGIFVVSVLLVHDSPLRYVHR